MEDRSALVFWLIVWGFGLFALLFGQWRSKHPGTALPLVYAVSLSLIHLFGGIIYALPWYEAKSLYLVHSGTNVAIISEGFRVSSIGFLGFVIGVLFVAPRLIRRNQPAAQTAMIDSERKRLPVNLMILGGIFFVFIAPVLGALPSIGAAAVSGVRFAVVGLALMCWKVWADGRRISFFKWLSFTAFFPALTTATMGFIGFGTNAAIAVWMFATNFYRPRWHVVVGFVAILYLGLSVFVTYFRDREEIRSVVWSGERQESFVEKAAGRVARIANTFVDWEFMDFTNQDHLEYIDIRLNQNLFVGQSMAHVASGGVELAKGRTLAWAAIAVIPRIVWPNKPIIVGGTEMISRYTGRDFGTSSVTFGIGNILEFYINFGTPGVFFGLMLLGTAIRFCDIQAGRFLINGDWWRFAAWFALGLGLIQPGTNLAHVATGTAAIGALIFFLYHMHFKKLYLPVGVSIQDARMGHSRKGKAQRRPMRRLTTPAAAAGAANAATQAQSTSQAQSQTQARPGSRPSGRKRRSRGVGRKLL